MKDSHERSLAPFDDLYNLSFPAPTAVPALRPTFTPGRYNRLFLFGDNTSDDVAIKGSTGLGRPDEHVIVFFTAFRDDENKTVPTHLDLTGHFLKFPLSALT